MITETHIPLWIVSFSSCTLLSSILTTFSSSMILSSCVFSVMLDIDLELTDSNVIVNIQNIYKMCVLDISYPLYFINCNKLDSEIFPRGCHRNLILAYFEELVTILTLEMNHMDEFVFRFFLFLHFISWFIYDKSQPWKCKHILRKKQDKWPWYQRWTHVYFSYT